MEEFIHFTFNEVFAGRLAERFENKCNEDKLYPSLHKILYDAVMIRLHLEDIPPKCFHLDSPDEDQILIGGDYTGLSLFDKAIGKIKNNLGSIIRREFNPTPEDLEYNKKVDEMTRSISAKMGVQASRNIDQADAFIEDGTIENGSSTSLLDNINSTITNIKNKLKSKIQDRRVFNGRKAEDHLCESFSDIQIIDLMKRTHIQLFGRELCVSPLLNRFLVCFQDALFKWIRENKNFDYILGKTAHYCRMVVETIGKYIGSGVRNIQKMISWFNTKLDFSSYKTIWECREEEKMREWKQCSSEIYDYLCVELPLIAEPD